MKRSARLQSAKDWIKKYSGKNIVKGYAKWYGVDKLCAIIEPRMLGIEVSGEYEAKVRQSIKNKTEANKTRKRKKIESQKEITISEYGQLMGYDETFAFIAGFTPGGFPFGITHEETENDDEMDFFN